MGNSEDGELGQLVRVSKCGPILGAAACRGHQSFIGVRLARFEVSAGQIADRGTDDLNLGTLTRAIRIEHIQPCGAIDRVRPPEDKSAIGQPAVTFHAVAYVRPSDSHCRTGVSYPPRPWLQRRSASIRPARSTGYDR